MFGNVTAVRPQGSGSGGYLTLCPYGESQPTASTINDQSDAAAVANGLLMPLGDPAAATCNYDLNVYNYTNLRFIWCLMSWLSDQEERKPSFLPRFSLAGECHWRRAVAILGPASRCPLSGGSPRENAAA